MSKPNRLAQLPDAGVRRPAVEQDRVRHRLVAEQDVLRHRQDRDEHEVLVDHADAAPDGVIRAVDLDGLAVEQDLALVRHGQAVEDVHERRLAGAVLAEQRVDLAGPHVERDAVVGDDAGIALRDPAHLEQRRSPGAAGRALRISRGGHSDHLVRMSDERANR